MYYTRSRTFSTYFALTSLNKILRTITCSLRQQYKPLNFMRQNIHFESSQRMEIKSREVRIPVPWGHIAGVWWGPENVKPLLCLHGYHDNAGTWDALIPLLPPEFSFLAVDFPGHGYSSHFPRGTQYYLFDFVLTVHRILNWYSWDKVSILSHSFGSIVAFIYTALYPERVQKYIAIDSMKPLTTDPEEKITNIVQSIDYFLQLDSLNPNTIPSYTYEEAVDRLHKSIKNWASKKACAILSKRGTIKLDDDSYIFSRDPRLKAFYELGFTHEFDMALAGNVKCKTLYIKANQGLQFGSQEMTEKFLKIVKDSAEYFEHYRVDGLHHVHLDFPERVAPSISHFLKSK